MPDTSHWLRLYESPNPSVRLRAAHALLERSAEVPLSVLLELTDASDPKLQDRAWVALCHRSEAELLPAMAQQLASSDADRRACACRVLGSSGNPEALSLVAPYLQDPSTQVRRAAAQAYEELRGSEADPLGGDSEEGAGEEDLEWVGDLCEALGERADERGPDSLTPAEQTVLLPYWLKGIVDNGGFQYFYEGATEAAEVAEAFERIGLPDLAEACRLSLDVFPDRRPPISQDAMFTWMEAQGPEVADLWERLSETVWACKPEKLYGALARYVRAHSESFSDVV